LRHPLTLDGLDQDAEGKEDGSRLREDDIEAKHFRLVKRKATKATAEEVAANPRSRSARLRCLERVR
jgi:16S rRNA C1402 N4-methylase RsmH